jgi:CO/xanthine dehydrogenase Mo-binding subunit
MVEYRVPRMSDLARRLDSRIVERGDGIGPCGAKGVGEGPMTHDGRGSLRGGGRRHRTVA